MALTFKYNEASWSVLAFMRFCLAFIVVCSHLDLYYFKNSLPPVLNLFNDMGSKAAVIGFFFISGLSIGHSYSQNNINFYRRRFLRIYPLYFVAVIFTVILQYTVGSYYSVPYITYVPAGFLTSIGNLLLLQGILVISITYNPAVWSLSVEVFYYVITPVLYRMKPVLLIITILLSMMIFSFFYTKGSSLFGVVLIYYIGFWLIGFLFATRKISTWAIIIFFLLSAYISHEVLWVNNIHEGKFSGLTVFLVAFIILIINNKQLKIPGFMQSLFNYLGEISYPLYLFHLPLFLFFYRYFDITNLYSFIILILITIIPINYVFDKVLKNVFWKPFAVRVQGIVKKSILKRK